MEKIGSLQNGMADFFSDLIASAALENGPMVSPFLMASSASFSIPCHSSVQNHSWSCDNDYPPLFSRCKDMRDF